jgi:hypothetical protein
MPVRSKLAWPVTLNYLCAAASVILAMFDAVPLDVANLFLLFITR